MDLLTPTTRVFDALVSRLQGTAFPLPERRYVTAGDIALDCDALVVSARQVLQGHPGQNQPGPIRPQAGYVENSLEIGVAYSQCLTLPASGIPTTDVADREGRAFIFNAALLLTALYEAYYARDLTPACDEASLSPAVFVGPEGGVRAVTVVVTVQVS